MGWLTINPEPCPATSPGHSPNLRTVIAALVLLNTCSIFVQSNSPPQFVEPSSEQTVQVSFVHESKGIRCIAFGGDTHIYTWWKFDRYGHLHKVTDDGSISIRTEGNVGSTLLIRSRIAEHIGDYTCAASAGQVTSYSPLIHVIISAPNSELCRGTNTIKTTKRPNEKDYFELPCALSRFRDRIPNVNVTFRWFDSKSMPAVLDKERMYMEFYTGSLLISNIQLKDDAKSYSCGMYYTESNVTRPLCTASEIYILKVKPVTGPMMYLQRVHQVFNHTAFLHSDAVLQCMDRGIAAFESSITWRDPHGFFITGNEAYYKISEHGRRLTIYDVSSNDRGDYECQLDSQKTKVHLEVISRPSFSNSSDRPAKLKFAKEGEDATFTCRVTSQDGKGTETPVWYVNGKRLDLALAKDQYKNDKSKGELTIKSMEDSLCVQCEVHNKAGLVWENSCVYVKGEETTSRGTTPKTSGEGTTGRGTTPKSSESVTTAKNGITSTDSDGFMERALEDIHTRELSVIILVIAVIVIGCCCLNAVLVCVCLCKGNRRTRQRRQQNYNKAGNREKKVEYYYIPSNRKVSDESRAS